MPDIVTGKTFVDGERGITATKLNQIISQAVIQPSFVTSKPASSTLDPTDQILEVKGAGTYATITGQQLIDSVSASVTQNITPTITAVRLRSFNAVGNPNFEVDQRNVGATVAAPASATGIIDRWFYQKSGTMVTSDGQQAATLPDIVVPTTNFRISRSFFRVTLTTAQASLGASDFLQIYQTVEGPRFRELQNDVHSVSLLVRSSVSGLKFGLALRDLPSSTRSLTKLCTIPSANTWVLIPLANLPVWPTAGNFVIIPGSASYGIGLTLAAGTTFTAPANDTWQNGNFIGALGQDNFAAQAANSTFDIAFIQHEPGALCSTLIDNPFSQNHDECLRYYSKSYDYGTAIGTVTNNGGVVFCAFASATNSFGYAGFKKPMAKVPGVGIYNPVTGAGGSIYNESNGTNYAASSVSQLGQNGFSALATAALAASPAYLLTFFHFIADTGW